jgi:pyruvate dehydrogenase E2 component (dihydrolipoamide acetyltransferase)
MESPAPVVEAHKNGQKISPVAQRLADDLGLNLATVSGSGPAGRSVAGEVRRPADHAAAPVDGMVRIVASPKAKVVARELQVDLRGLTGTGVDGMLRVKDVEMAARQVSAAASTVLVTAQALSKARQTIAQRTAQSKQTVPHFYLMSDVNMTQVKTLRHYCVATLGWERPPTYTDVLLRVAALALADMPEANLHFTAQGLVQHESVGVGVAIHTDAGLVAPVIAGADQLDLRATSQALRDLAARAREGRMRPGDTGQKALVISNLGMYSVDAFIAIIDMPDPMILAVGQVAERVVPIDGQVVVQPMCTLTLSVDHRALDGVPAARFLERIKARLENPFDIVNASAVR